MRTILAFLEEHRPEEERILLAISRFRMIPLTVFLKVISYSGVGAAYGAVVVLLIALNYSRIEVIPRQRLFLNCMWAALLSWFVTRPIKIGVARKRPLASGALIPIPRDLSFPSGHSSASTALFISLLTAGHPAAPIVGVWAALVCFSRLYLGVHFLTDVGMGILIGVVCGLIGQLFS